MAKEMWEVTQKNLLDYMGRKKAFPADELFTNEFLPGKI